MSEVTALDIRRAAITLLARRDYSLHELRDRLLQKFAPSSRLFADGGPVGVSPVDMDSGDMVSSDMEVTSSVNIGESSGSLAILQMIVEQQLGLLVEEKLQSDDRFVESFINGRKAKGHGPRRIRHALRQKHVSEQLLEEYLDENDPEWFERAKVVYCKKFGSGTPRDYREKARRMRFMQQRGFPLWIIEALFSADPVNSA